MAAARANCPVSTPRCSAAATRAAAGHSDTSQRCAPSEDPVSGLMLITSVTTKTSTITVTIANARNLNVVRSFLDFFVNISF